MIENTLGSDLNNEKVTTSKFIFVFFFFFDLIFFLACSELGSKVTILLEHLICNYLQQFY